MSINFIISFIKKMLERLGYKGKRNLDRISYQIECFVEPTVMRNNAFFFKNAILGVLKIIRSIKITSWVLANTRRACCVFG